MKIIYIFCVVSILTACASGIKSRKTINPYTQEATYLYEPITTASCENSEEKDNSVTIGLMGVKEIDTFILRYKGKIGMFINPNVGLELYVDDKVVWLKGTNINETTIVFGPDVVDKKPVYTGSILESVYYQVTQDVLNDIGRAQKVKLVISGQNRTEERCLYTDELKKLLIVLQKQ